MLERPNPRYMEDEMYGINCQTCVLAYKLEEELILEGYYENANLYSAIYRNKDELSCIDSCIYFRKRK